MRRWLVALACLAGCAGSHAALPTPPTSSTSATPSSAPTTTEATTTTTVKQERPFSVASTQLTFVDTARGRTLPTTVWRPAVPGRWPLVVFGHGFRVGVAPYVALCQAWARAGYVVAAPTFLRAVGPSANEADLQNQPADLSFVITSLVGASYVDPNRVAVAGHSDGGEAALAVGFSAGMADPRVRAVIALSVQPLPGGLVQPSGGRPVLFGQGDVDTINPYSLGLAAYNQARAPKFLLILHGAGHLPPFAGGSRWDSVVDRVTVDFLDRYVAGVAAPLEADGSVPGISTLDAVEKT